MKIRMYRRRAAATRPAATRPRRWLAALLVILACQALLFWVLSFWMSLTADTGGKCDAHCKAMVLFDTFKRVVYALTFGLIGGCTAHTSNCNYWYDIGRDMPQCERVKMYEMLTNTKKVFAELGVTWWLAAGTLLGSVRHGDLIPWDGDLDTCVLLESNVGTSGRNWSRLDTAIATLERRYGYARAGTTYSVWYSASNHIHIDFFDCYIVDGWHSHWITKNKTYENEIYAAADRFSKGHPLMTSTDSASAVNMPVSLFLPTRDCKIGPLTLPCPHNPLQALITGLLWKEHPVYTDDAETIKSLITPHYRDCMNGCPRRDKKRDVREVKRSICWLHAGGWPSLYHALQLVYGPGVCETYQQQSVGGIDGEQRPRLRTKHFKQT